MPRVCRSAPDDGWTGAASRRRSGGVPCAARRGGGGGGPRSGLGGRPPAASRGSVGRADRRVELESRSSMELVIVAPRRPPTLLQSTRDRQRLAEGKVCNPALFCVHSCAAEGSGHEHRRGPGACALYLHKQPLFEAYRPAFASNLAPRSVPRCRPPSSAQVPETSSCPCADCFVTFVARSSTVYLLAGSQSTQSSSGEALSTSL